MFSNYIFFFCYFLFLWKDSTRIGFVEAILKPLTIINTYLLVFFIIPIEAGIVFFSQFITNDSFTRYFPIISNMILLLSLTMRLFDKWQNKYDKQIHFLKPSFYNFSLQLSLTGFFIFITLIMISVLLLAIQAGSITSTAMQLRNGGALKFFLVASCEAIPLLFLIYSGGKMKSRFFLVLFLSMTFIIFLGARALLLSLTLSIFYFLLSKQKIDTKKIFVFSSLFIILFTVSSLNRSGGKDLLGYLTRNIDQLTNTAVVMGKIDSNKISYQYGSTLVDGIYFLIPTSIWPDKPRSYVPSRLVYPEMIQAGIRDGTKFTMNFGLIGRSYLEGGITAVFTISLLLMTLMNKLYYRIKNNSFKSNWELFFGIYIISHIHQFLIIGPTSHIYSIYFINLLLFGSIILFTKFVYQIRHLKKK